MQVQVDGGSILVHSSGSGPGLVVVHGAAVGARDYTRLAKRLESRFTVHRYDRGGRGTSPAHDAERLLDEEVAHLDAILQVTGARLIFGHSMGGQIALHAGRTLDLDRIAVYDPASTMGDMPTDFVDRMSAAVERGDLPTAVMEVGRGLQNPGHTLPRPVLMAIARLYLMTPIGKRFGATMPATVQEVRSLIGVPPEVYREITVPTSFLWGARSQSFFELACRRIAELVPAATTLTPIPRASHNTPNIAPAPFATARTQALLPSP